MTDVYLTPLTHWPDGAPRTLVDGRPDAPITQPDTALAIVPSSGINEVFDAVQDLAVDLGHFNPPTNTDELRAPWYGRAPGFDKPWMPARRSGQRPPRLLALPLASIPTGTDVFVMRSYIDPRGEEHDYAELPNVPLPYHNPAGVQLWTLPGESPSLPSEGYPLSAEQIKRNELIRRGRKRVSRWVPARVGGTPATPGLYIDGVLIPFARRSSLLSVGATPPRASSLQLASITGGLPWFRSLHPLDAREGLIAGEALATVESNMGRDGLFAVESDPSTASAPWYVLSLRR